MDDLLPDLTLAFNETFQMLSISTVLAILGGLPLGFLIFVTDRHLFWQNRFIYLVASVLVNIIRSVPFVILLVLLLPLTQLLLGNTIGPIAASVPLSVAAIAFYARLVDSALREVDKGIIEAALAFGASPMRIICTVLLPEASAGSLRGLTITLVSDRLLGDGRDCRRRRVGDLAIRYGYYRYETEVMVVTVVALIVLVQVVQMLGDWLAKRADKRDRH